jgi:hypothetical protein
MFILSTVKYHGNVDFSLRKTYSLCSVLVTVEPLVLCSILTTVETSCLCSALTTAVPLVYAQFYLQ